jgi:glutathione S-transferase
MITFALVLVLTVCMLTACSGGDAATTAPADKPAATQAPAPSADSTDLTALLKQLKQKNVELANLYNEIAELANKNGWLNDELTIADMNGAAAFVQAQNSIIKDSSQVKADELQEVLNTTDIIITELDTNVRARVSVPNTGK